MTNTDTQTRANFPEKLVHQVQLQFTAFTNKDMTGYTWDKTKSEFYRAKSDLRVYDSDGMLKLLGRDFGDRIFFWQPQ